MDVEVKEFSDGRLMTLCRFRLCSNFKKDEDSSFTYVPRLKEVRILVKTLDAINDYNNRADSRKPSDSL